MTMVRAVFVTSWWGAAAWAVVLAVAAVLCGCSNGDGAPPGAPASREADPAVQQGDGPEGQAKQEMYGNPQFVQLAPGIALPASAVGFMTNGNVFCSATIVGRSRILSAAHCFCDEKTGQFVPPGSSWTFQMPATGVGANAQPTFNKITVASFHIAADPSLCADSPAGIFHPGLVNDYRQDVSCGHLAQLVPLASAPVRPSKPYTTSDITSDMAAAGPGSYLAVGYGGTQWMQGPVGAAIRRMGETSGVHIADTGEGLRLDDNDNIDSGGMTTAPGDSGGPLYFLLNEIAFWRRRSDASLRAALRPALKRLLNKPGRGGF